MKKSTIGSLLILFSTILFVPKAIAQTADEPSDTRIEKYDNLTETNPDSMTSESDMNSESMGDMEENMQQDAEEPSTRTEEKLQEVQSSNNSSNSSDIRSTEAFNLVSSAYRGDFEDQGINSYATLVSNYETGELTAEDLIKAAIESGDLSPEAMKDESYVQAVDFQLDSLINQ